MSAYLKVAVVSALSLSLAACGGGGGGSGPITSTDSFPMATAFKNQIDSGYFHDFTVTGSQTVSGTTYHVSGSGNISVSPATPSTFEGQAALLNSETLSGTLVVNGTTAPFSSTAQEYATTSYAPFGIVTSSEYCVMQGSPSIPSTVKVGDTAAVGTYTCYTDGSKTTVLGTGQLSYVVEADTEHTAILNLIEKDFDSTNSLQVTDQTRWRIDTFGNLTWVSEAATGPSYSYVFK